MLNLIPNKKQYQNWSLPSKLTAISTVLAVIGILLFFVDKIVLTNNVDVNHYYSDGKSALHLNDYETAEKYFAIAYNQNRLYKDLAYQYGVSLLNNNKNNKALEVFSNIPSSEIHKNLNLWKAFAFHRLDKQFKAKEYYRKFLKFASIDNLYYWSAKARLLLIEYKTKPIIEFDKNVNNFLLEIQAYEENRNTTTVPIGISKEFIDKSDNSFKNKIPVLLLQKNIAFHLLRELAFSYRAENNFDLSFQYFIKSLTYRNHPFITNDFIVSKLQILAVLENINSYLHLYEIKGIRQKKFFKSQHILQKIADSEKSNQICEICDYAKIILLINGRKLNNNTIHTHGFRFKYSSNIKDNVGIDKIRIESPDFILGSKEIQLNNIKNYTFQRLIKLNTPQEFIEPYLKLTAVDTNGNSSSMIVYPIISYTLVNTLHSD